MVLRATHPRRPGPRSRTPGREALPVIEAALNRRFRDLALRYLDGDVPSHEVTFSHRLTTSWALIYYDEQRIRLSPYVFLLDSHELATGSHWRELDATLRHELAHAYLHHHTGERGHGPRFAEVLQRLGVDGNGRCDVGPPNPTWRLVYACPECGNAWARRAPLRGDWSCRACSPGAFDARYRMALLQVLPSPGERLRERAHVMRACLREARADLRAAPQPVPLVRAWADGGAVEAIG